MIVRRAGMSFITESFNAVQSIASQQLIRLNITNPDMRGVKYFQFQNN
jgi:hypothetical protein